MNQYSRLLFTLIIFSLSVLVAVGCDDDPTSPGEPDDPNDDPPAIELTSEEAAQMLYDYMVEMGWIPSEDAQSKSSTYQAKEFEGDKFIEVGDSDTGDFVIRLYYDENGSIIPNTDWFDQNPQICGNQYRLNRSSERILEIEVDLSAEMMRMELINAETDETIHSHESEIVDQDDWFIELIEEMFLEFDDANIFEPFEAECGLFEGPIKIHFDSLIESEVITDELSIMVNSAVHAEIELDLSEDSNSYSGEAVLSHRLYENTLISEFGCEVSLTDGVMSVVLLADEFNTISDLELVMNTPFRSDEAPSATISCEGFEEMGIDFPATLWFPTFVLFHEDNVSEDGWFTFTDWDHSGESDIIGLLEFEDAMDLTDFDAGFEGSESMPVTEITRIEIQPNP